MIGYWQSMEANDVLSEVHEESRGKSLPDLILLGAWQPAGVSHLEHTFERPFQVSPFRLQHLWIDLRQNASVG
jgi:hypothetical protein